MAQNHSDSKLQNLLQIHWSYWIDKVFETLELQSWKVKAAIFGSLSDFYFLDSTKHYQSVSFQNWMAQNFDTFYSVAQFMLCLDGMKNRWALLPWNETQISDIYVKSQKLPVKTSHIKEICSLSLKYRAVFKIWTLNTQM